MTTQESFQIPPEAAEMYEAKFVPAIFAEWAPHILDAASVAAGNRVLDVGCGTGIVARTAAERVGDAGAVVGLDLNEAMLTVARRIAPEIEWLQGSVDGLPFEGGTFDATLCQMALMFFPDRRRALAELARVTRTGGRVAVVVPAGLEAQPAYRRFVDVAARHAGDEARSLLAAYWSCGDLGVLAATMRSAGLDVVESRSRTGTARFESAEDFVATEVEGSPLVERIDDETYSSIRRDVADEMAGYSAGGRFEVPLVCHVVAATPVR